jgi:hypothetical protein
MAFQGLYQSLTQLAIGTLLSGNDVGRALGYLGVGAAGHILLLVLAVAAMALAGAWLARRTPQAGTRNSGYGLLLTALLSVIVVIPFRLPRNLIEVALIPLIVNLVGIGWLILGTALVRRGAGHGPNGNSPQLWAPRWRWGEPFCCFSWCCGPESHSEPQKRIMIPGSASWGAPSSIWRVFWKNGRVLSKERFRSPKAGRSVPLLN